MADHLRDVTKKADFISRDKVHVQIERALCEGLPYHRTIDEIPAADVVARDCYDRILAENDTVRKQLAQIGKKPGDKMDDVRTVVKAHWIYHEDDYGDYYECSHCHDEYVVYESDMEWKFCPTCGAEMEKMITGKDANGRT